MKVLVWTHGFKRQIAGSRLATEAKRQGFDVRVTGSATSPRSMIVAVREYQPDFVFCFVINSSYGRWYRAIRRTGAKLVFWYPDHPRADRDRVWFGPLRGAADVVICSILDTAQRYKSVAPLVLWMPQYFDRRFCLKDGELPKRLNPELPIYDICFIGSCDSRRARWLNELAHRYKCFFARDGIKHGKELRGRDMAKVYAQSKIAINIQRKSFINNGLYVTSNRIYNAMGSGAFFINHPVTRLDLVFDEGKYCVMYETEAFGHMRLLIDYYLKHPVKREKIALAGQEQITQHHTLEQRVTEYWAVMTALHENKLGAVHCLHEYMACKVML